MRKDMLTFALTFALSAPWFLPISGGNAGEMETVTWRDLPAVVFQNCIAVTHHLGPHPLGLMENHFLEVSSYEEPSNPARRPREQRPT